MIYVRDWVASIPDEDKHIAYVGEGKSEQKEFLLTGKGWETYKDWAFHLDMAFDPTSITTRDSRQVVQTTVNSSEHTDETGITKDAVTTKETYTVDDVQVTNHYLTDIAPLTKQVTDGGILLTWNILRQHTVLPGKLWATIRAVDGTEQRIKKSAIMTFEVEAAICAVPSTVPPISEFEQMEQSMDALRLQVEEAASNVQHASAVATLAAESASDSMQAATAVMHTVANHAAQVESHHASVVANTLSVAKIAEETQEYMTQAIVHADLAATRAQQAQAHCKTAQDAATSAMEQAAQSATAATAAENARAAAAQEANQAAKQRAQAEQAATFAGNARDEAVATLEEVKKEIAAGGGDGNTEGNAAYNRINVRDYGAVGDGVTNDQPAIWAAITAVKEQIAQDIPCELYFPSGIYGFLEGGMGIALPRGKGDLRITGAGRETTIIKYLDNWTPSSKYGGSVWYALDVWASGGDTGEPDTYIHDVNITGLTVYDPNPCAHNRHPDKGDSEKEENHGINIAYCLRASVTDCQFISVGDEAIDIYSCTDVVVMNNHCVDSPGAGTDGGAISICDGCVGVVVSNNTVNGSALDETLDDGTVIQKTNFGIAVESLYTPVRDVVIANNVVCNIQGNGINLAATNDGAGIYDVRIDSNIIRGCNNAIGSAGKLPKEWVSISNNTISDCVKLRSDTGRGVSLSTEGFTNATISGNTIHNTDGVGIYVYGDSHIVDGNKLENIGTVAVFIQGSAIVRDCIIKNTGVVSSTGNGAIHGYDPSGAENPTYSVYGCHLTGVRQAIGINNATVVENTTIEMVDADGNPVTSEQPLGTCYYLKRLVNCQMDGYIKIRNANAIVQGVTVTCTQAYQPAFSVSANGVIITDCQIKYTGYKNAITEASGKDGNLFVNNITNSAITTVGANTVAQNIVSSKWVDNTVTE